MKICCAVSCFESVWVIYLRFVGENLKGIYHPRNPRDFFKKSDNFAHELGPNRIYPGLFLTVRGFPENISVRGFPKMCPVRVLTECEILSVVIDFDYQL